MSVVDDWGVDDVDPVADDGLEADEDCVIADWMGLLDTVEETLEADEEVA